jgi:tetratricopeptide (TPR) repeat protein
VRLFGEKLAAHFPLISYDVYLWLASVFEVTYSSSDNYELAVFYYQKAAEARPEEPDPYLDACDCYDPDLNIPPLPVLIEFVKRGATRVNNPASLYRRLSHLYHMAGDEEQSDLYRQMAERTPPSPAAPPAPPA